LPAPFSAGALGHPGARPRRLLVFALVASYTSHSCVAARLQEPLCRCVVDQDLKQALSVDVTLDELEGGTQSDCSSTRASNHSDKDNRIYQMVLSGVRGTLCRGVLGGPFCALNCYEGPRRLLFSVSTCRCPLLYLAEPGRKSDGSC
jgi:hypothetical protein